MKCILYLAYYYNDQVLASYLNQERHLKNVNFLVAKKKVRNAEDSEKSKKKIYKKKNIRILIAEKNEMYRSVPQEVLDFKNKHLYGTRIKREKNFIGKI